MKIRVLLLALLASGLFATTSFGQSADDLRLRDKITEAVMKVYDEALAKTPGDYETRFARANQLYYNGEYDAAMADANMVLQQAPAKATEIRFDTQLLQARILDAQGRYADEVALLETAHSGNTASLACVDLLGKAYLHNGDADKAEQQFKTILRDTPTNYDAMYGLAQADLLRGRYNDAIDHVDDAVKLFSAEPQVYLNRADILNRCGRHEQAAKNLVSAFLVSNDESAALNAMFRMSDKHYDAMMSTLATTSDQAPQEMTIPYVRAMIAIRHFHYGQALSDLKRIINNDVTASDAIFYYTALCQKELLQWDDAMTNINKAIALQSTDPDYYVLKSTILLHRGEGNNTTQALAPLERALEINPNHYGAQVARTRILLQQRADAEALIAVNAAVAAYPRGAEALMLRGWIQKYRLNNSAVARADFETVAALDGGLETLKGFALHELGRDDEARLWAYNMVQTGVIPGGEPYYYAACLLSDIGDSTKDDPTQAMNYVRSMLANGFGSLYQVNVNEEPYVNLKLARRYPDYQTVISLNPSNFEERR